MGWGLLLCITFTHCPTLTHNMQNIAYLFNKIVIKLSQEVFLCEVCMLSQSLCWFPAQSKNMQVRWIRDAKLSVGVSLCEAQAM